MYNYNRLPISFLGRNVLKAAAISSLLVFSNAYATGLGKLTVLSSLGQPLRAEIELTSPNKEEVNSLVPKVASIEAFRQANIEFNPALLSLRFAIEQRGTAYVIRVSSTQAMNEPWIDFLLEMNASNGKLVREYTALLDPAELGASQPVQVTSLGTTRATNKSNNVGAQVAIESVKEKSTPNAIKPEAKKNHLNLPPETKQSSTSPVAESRQYQVKSGDTLMRIASNHLGGVSLDQMLVSIYRANPKAFVGENMNRLKAGQILSIPDAESVRANPSPDAHTTVQTHSADFNAYRNKLAGQVLNQSVEKLASSKHAASGAITTKVKELPTATNESLDKLKLSKVPASASAKGATVKGMLEEDRIAKDKALADANARVKELERNVGELNKLLAVPSKTTASVSASSASVKAHDSKVDAVVKPQVPVVASASVERLSPATVASASVSASAVHSASANVVDSNANAASGAVVAKPENASTASVASVAASAVSKPKKAPIAPPPPVEEESSWFDVKYLLGAGLLLALAGGIGFYLNKRRKAIHQFEDSILTGSSLKANSMFGSTGGQSVDTNNSVFNSNFAPSASQLDANEVDPVAEADVYIAYGRDSQAEEILKEALRTQPDRHAVRLKLLEIYFGRKDLRSFEVFAGELYGMTRGEGEEWGQAASMGIALDPTNPLYAGASAQVEGYASGGLGLPTQPLEDIDPESLMGHAVSEDMLDSISIIDTASAMSDEGLLNHSAEKAKLSSTADDFSFDMGALDFDLDISAENSVAEDVIPSIPEPVSLPVPQAEPVQEKRQEEEPVPAIDFGSIDFDLGDGDFGSEIVAEPVKIGSAKTDSLPSIATASGNEMEFTAVADSEGDAFKLDIADFQFQEPQELPAQVSAMEHINFAADSNLSSESQEEASVLNADDLSPYNAEMATKLDLALAYQEIGDKEGARELLEEVIKGGSNDQIEKAQTMMDQLS